VDVALRPCGGTARLSAKLLDGCVRLLGDVNWDCLAVEPELHQVLGLCAQAANEGRLDGDPLCPARSSLVRMLATCGNAPRHHCRS
jgi:hypothetical protein